MTLSTSRLPGSNWYWAWLMALKLMAHIEKTVWPRLWSRSILTSTWFHRYYDDDDSVVSCYCCAIFIICYKRWRSTHVCTVPTSKNHNFSSFSDLLPIWTKSIPFSEELFQDMISLRKLYFHDWFTFLC